MELKKSYAEKYGYERVITARNSVLAFEEIDMLKLADGKSFSVSETGKEFALIVLGGTCTVKGDGFSFEKVGKRKTPFDGVAEGVYIGRNMPFIVTAVGGDVRVCVAKAPAEKTIKPYRIDAAQVRTKMLGKGPFERFAAFNLDENCEAQRLYIGEFWMDDGNWASFPPHKHDVDDMPVEGALDEVYYFEFDKPQGFGVQFVYSKDGTLNEAYKIQTGDFVEVPKGYHPCSVAPGYKCYCLWIMAGNNRGLFSTTQEEHKWINESYTPKSGK